MPISQILLSTNISSSATQVPSHGRIIVTNKVRVPISSQGTATHIEGYIASGVASVTVSNIEVLG